jgi:hypothetical protein
LTLLSTFANNNLLAGSTQTREELEAFRQNEFFLSPGHDILEAYAALPATGGVLRLSAGPNARYDIGAGLVITRQKPVAIVGPERFWRNTALAGNHFRGVIPEIFSSGTPANLITLSQAAPGANMYGCTFKNLVFAIEDNATQYCIRGENWNKCVVDDCLFYVEDVGVTDNDQVAIRITQDTSVTTGDDCSWWRIFRCDTRRMALFESGTSNELRQDNHHIIQSCRIGGHGEDVTPTPPAVRLNGNHRSTVRDVNIENFNQAILLDMSHQCTIDADTGETCNFYVDLQNGSHSNMINVPGVGGAGPDAGDRLVRIIGASGGDNNIIISAALTSANSLYDANAIEDQTTNKDNFIWAPSRDNSRAQIKLLHEILTANLPAAAADEDRRIILEDGGAGDRNLIIYSKGQRFRIDGGTAF